MLQYLKSELVKSIKAYKNNPCDYNRDEVVRMAYTIRGFALGTYNIKLAGAMSTLAINIKYPTQSKGLFAKI